MSGATVQLVSIGLGIDANSRYHLRGAPWKAWSDERAPQHPDGQHAPHRSRLNSDFSDGDRLSNREGSRVDDLDRATVQICCLHLRQVEYKRARDLTLRVRRGLGVVRRGRYAMFA